MFIRSHTGFTLIELIMVITILGILSVVAIPKFFDLREQAKQGAAKGIQAAGESGAQLWRARYLIDSSGTYSTEYPADSASCFDVLPDLSNYTVSYSTTNGKFTVTPL